jgi:hypothetical protein
MNVSDKEQKNASSVFFLCNQSISLLYLLQVATERKSFLPLRLRATTIVGSSKSPTSSRPTTPVPMSLAAQNDALVVNFFRSYKTKNDLSVHF